MKLQKHTNTNNINNSGQIGDREVQQGFSLEGIEPTLV